MAELPIVVAVLPGGAVPLCLVAGLAGHELPLWCYLDDRGRARTIGHAHGVPACIPDGPPAKGASSVATLLRIALDEGMP